MAYFRDRSPRPRGCVSKPFPQPFFTSFSRPVRLTGSLVTLLTRPYNPQRSLRTSRFGLIRFRSPLLSESHLLSFPPGTEMVHFPGFASPTYVFSRRYIEFINVGFPIRTSPDQSLFAAPRSLSQLTTSFIACWRQGIHRTPLVA